MYDDLRAARMLLRAGVSPLDVALFPIRRRLPRARSQIHLRGGITLSAAASEPLLFLFKEIWIERAYDSETWTGRPLEDEGAIVDIGAHVGVFTVRAATRHRSGRVVALEPSPRSLPYLRANVAANRLSNVTIVPLACGGSRRQATLTLGGADMTSSLYARPSALARTALVEVVTLDDVFTNWAIESCALLKLDCEGAEYEILFGASPGTLARIHSVVLEYHLGVTSYGPEDLAAHLRRSGFEVRLAPSQTDRVHGYLFAAQHAAPRAAPVRSEPERIPISL